MPYQPSAGLSKTERVPEVQVNIAYALLQMGEDVGVRTLRRDCDDNGMPMDLRLSAAYYLLTSHDESCLSTVVAALQPDSEAVDRAQAIYLVPRFKKLPPAELDNLRTRVLNALRDQDPTGRLAASDTLRTLGDKTAIPYLEAAISTEDDVDTRARMESDLQGLRSTKR